jgi:hypothetical protein
MDIRLMIGIGSTIIGLAVVIVFTQVPWLVGVSRP